MGDEQHFIYDLLSELRRDPARRSAVEAALKRVDSVAQEFAHGKATRQDITEAEAALIPLCGFNFGLLIPRMFPHYPYEDPLDFSNRPFMFATSAQAPSSVVTLKAGRQVGKCADGNTLVETATGTITMRELFDEGVPLTPQS
jgi:hypothetical protein